MPGMLDFMTNIGRDGQLAGAFMRLATRRCTQQELLDFFHNNAFPDVTEADVVKILEQKEAIRNEFNVPDNVDY
jgi:hypothetical protein